MSSKNPTFASSFEGLEQMIKHLNGPNGCPWDKEQTSISLIPMFIEECYELVDAIKSNNIENIIEEIGDVIFHIGFQIQIANSLDLFDSNLIFHNVIKKYIHRHPHVFQNKEFKDMPELKKTWEAIKKVEKGKERDSILDGVPKSLPALAYSKAIQKKASNIGFDWETLPEIDEKMIEEINEFKNAESDQEREEEFGDLIFTLVNIGRHQGIDAEQALRISNNKFYSRFKNMEKLSQERGQIFEDLNIKEKDALWDEVKYMERDIV